MQSTLSVSEKVVIEPATEADLDELSEMLGGLFKQESDFRPDKDKQLRGLRLIFEQPSRGRVFVLRRDGAIVPTARSPKQMRADSPLLSARVSAIVPNISSDAASMMRNVRQPGSISFPALTARRVL